MVGKQLILLLLFSLFEGCGIATIMDVASASQLAALLGVPVVQCILSNISAHLLMHDCLFASSVFWNRFDRFRVLIHLYVACIVPYSFKIEKIPSGRGRRSTSLVRIACNFPLDSMASYPVQLTKGSNIACVCLVGLLGTTVLSSEYLLIWVVRPNI